MSVLLEVARVAALVNLGLLLLLGYVWGSNYRIHRAKHTLGLLIFAGFLFLQNALWIYLYVFDDLFIFWFQGGGSTYQVSMTLLCGLQTVALLFLFRITWR